MKAIIAIEKGRPETLSFHELDEPEPIDEEIKIKVHAFGLNKAEMYNLQR